VIQDQHIPGMDSTEYSFEVPELDIDLSDIELPKDAPRPLLWRLLVVPPTFQEETKGGIIIPEVARQRQQLVNFLGRVAAIGSLAYKTREFAQEEDPPEIGDYILFGRHAGIRIEYRDKMMLLINDSEVLAKAKDPSGFRVYV
jgi:co-chaperonin GroES (HSP10)